ncbi:MAG: glycosyltransferase [Pseudomonadota bacterium]|nr:glycosyltransferase [Pseudomonadota bacterium]
MPHGVDIDLFGADTQRPDDLPEERPVAGFVGTLADWIDIDLIKGVAEALPGWLFVLIGSVRTDLHGLDRMANVVLLGPRPHATLPAYLQHMDVAMLPFKDNAQIRACNPLKLREYLASGVPVATTDFPALDGYRDLVHISARTPDAFADAICKSGKEGRTRSDVRLARVAGESWTERAHRAEAWMERL